MHDVNYSVKVSEEIKFYLLINDMVANSMSTTTIYPIIMLCHTCMIIKLGTVSKSQSLTPRLHL
jgi:hypothetical protein